MRSGRQRWAAALAFAFLDGDWTVEGLERRGSIVVGSERPAFRWLVGEVIRGYPRPPWDRWRELAAWLDAQPGLEAALGEQFAATPRRCLLFQPAMGAMPWPVPAIATSGELAHLLDLGIRELAWFADVRSLERTATVEQLRHYRYRWIPKSDGANRLLEAPKLRLRRLQRLILRAILDHVPAHPAAHGFVAGRSAISFARVHAGAAVLVRLDLSDFFTSIAAGRVFGVFRTAGYPEDVAYMLTGLTTNAVPAAIWQDLARPAGTGELQRHFMLGKRLAAPHLPQGAPTSPTLANLCAYRLDRRLSGLAERFGLRYGRYADDLAFSGSPTRAGTKRLIELAGTIVAEEGFALNPAKTSVMTQGGRQRLTGMVVNRHPNLSRTEYDHLRATLHNAAEHGLDAQNRERKARFGEHLAGRVSWVAAVNPERGRALRQLLAEVGGEDSPAGG